MKSSGVEWIGEIPEDWEVKRVKNFLSERTGGAWGDEKRIMQMTLFVFE